MKRFLKGKSGAMSYDDVEITWIRGRAPTLHIKEDGVAKQSINLSTYTEEKLHALFKAKGFRRRSSSASADGRAFSIDARATKSDPAALGRFSFDEELHKQPGVRSVARYTNTGNTGGGAMRTPRLRGAPMPGR